MNIRKSVEVCHNFTFLHVEDHELIGVHVSDVETAMRRVKALIVKAHRRPGQRDVRDFL